MASPAVESYVYKPLTGERDFRLVTLLQGTGDGPISLTIHHASLDEKPTYEALSYVWGPQNPAQIVQCNGCNLQIGENLAAALRCLRNTEAPRVVWIDRVAIDQENSGIGSACLARPLGCSTHLAFNLIDKISGQMVDVWKSRKALGDTTIITEKYTGVFPPQEDPGWLAVRSLISRPWFARVWTFQEIVLAKRARFYCGTHTRDWDVLSVVSTCLNTIPQGPNIEDRRLKGSEKHLDDIVKARLVLQNPKTFTGTSKEDLLSLFPLLDGMRGRSATDPRDKVFALLNVACDIGDCDLRADYSKSHAEVYAMTAKWLMRRTRSLAFLSLVEKKDKPDLISWVPDFRYKDHMNFLHQPSQVWRGHNRIYNASGATIPTFIEEESMFQLTVRGIYVGTIIDQTEPPGNMLNNIALGVRALDGGAWESFARTCAIDGVYVPTGEPIDLAYQRLRIFDKLPREADRRRRKSPPTNIEPPKPETLSYNGSNIFGPTDGVAMAILTSTSRKRLFKTDTGYMGLAHRSCQIGDKIYVIMGGDMPFVVRSQGGNFCGFGGETYVHGIMDGEMLALAMSADRSLTRNTTTDLAWIDELGGEPWPFKTESLTLV